MILPAQAGRQGADTFGGQVANLPHVQHAPASCRRPLETDLAGAEEAVGGEAGKAPERLGQERSSGYGMKPDEIAKLMLDLERSVQMRTMLRQKLASNQEVDLVEEWKESSS